MDDLTGRSNSAVRGHQREDYGSEEAREDEGRAHASGGESKKYADSTESDAMGTGSTGVTPVHSASGDETGATAGSRPIS